MTVLDLNRLLAGEGPRVEPYPVPPVVKVDGVAWVRVGTTTRRATEADLSRLQERRPEHRLPFDSRPCHGVGLEELDLALLRLVYAAERAAHEDWVRRRP